MNVVLYRRVSTQKQGFDGLGMAAQDALIQTYLASNPGVAVISEYEEVETGTNKRKRPMLRKALHDCQIYDATLVVATLSRLSRSVNFISGLMAANVKFIALDCPNMDKTMTYFLSVMSEWEADIISKRVKDALKAAKVRGPVYCDKRQRMTFDLGAKGKCNLTEEAKAKGREEAAKKIQENSLKFAQRIAPILKDCLSQGMNLSQMANRLTQLRVKSARGRTQWYPSGVSNILARLGGFA